jgi:hypothetical protein
MWLFGQTASVAKDHRKPLHVYRAKRMLRLSSWLSLKFCFDMFVLLIVRLFGGFNLDSNGGVEISYKYKLGLSAVLAVFRILSFTFEAGGRFAYPPNQPKSTTAQGLIHRTLRFLINLYLDYGEYGPTPSQEISSPINSVFDQIHSRFLDTYVDFDHGRVASAAKRDWGIT